MRVRGKGAVLIGHGGLQSPPEPFIEVSEDEGRALIGLGVAEEVDVVFVEKTDETEAAEKVDGEASDAGLAEPVTPSAAEETPPAETLEPAPPAEAEIADQGQPLEGTNDAPVEPAERDAAILEAFEILADADMVKTGEREGRPKVKAIEDATGFDDVTVEEVDRLWAARSE
jgi:hypothetical protein